MSIRDLSTIKTRKGKPLRLPYIGSKKKISKRLFQFIKNENPNGFFFYDIFAGGCAMSYEAMVNGVDFVANVYDKRVVKILESLDNFNPLEIICSRDEFYTIAERLKKPGQSRTKSVYNSNGDELTGREWLVLLVNSFGNDMRTYLYAKEIADEKYTIVKKILENHGLIDHYKSTDTYMHEVEKTVNLQGYFASRPEKNRRLQQLSGLEQIQRLWRVSQINKTPVISQDYKDVKINHDNAMIYCDPPYWDSDFDGYKGIDFDEFVEWVRKQKHPCYISHYMSERMDNAFRLLVGIFPKTVSTLAGGNNGKRCEAVYFVR